MKPSNLHPQSILFLPPTSTLKPTTSIVVTTKNEEKNIGNCLKSIRAQSYPHDKIEIIVVDNFSTDKTREIALKYTDKVYSKGPERSAQRNFGMMDIAKGKYVMFVDADMILSPAIVEACVKSLEQQNAGSHTPVPKTQYLTTSSLPPPTSNLPPLTSNLQPPTSPLQPPPSNQRPSPYTSQKSSWAKNISVR